ncbi:MAG: hypothetical protein CL675_08115 [Bdellovibrionaceae bacterium]|nr:hypothetical protein [Pseudobdellovibrionaceae bacterium]
MAGIEKPILGANPNMETPESVEALGFEIHYISCPSSTRGENPNEDSFLILESDDSLVLAVADGLGGHEDGAVASRHALQRLAAELKKAENIDAESLMNAIEKSNRRLSNQESNLSTTLVLAHIKQKSLRFYTIGDSLGALYSEDRKPLYRTLEHSVGGFGRYAGLDVENRDDNHYLVNALGDEQYFVQISPELELKTQDWVMLATDGFSQNLGKTVPESSGPNWTDLHSVDDLRFTAQSNQTTDGHPDDITVIFARMKS